MYQSRSQFTGAGTSDDYPKIRCSSIFAGCPTQAGVPSERRSCARWGGSRFCLSGSFDLSSHQPLATAFKSPTSLPDAARYESCSFHRLKSGMKYSRTTRAASIPRSASNTFHFFTSSIAASVIGNNRFFFSRSSRCRALAISVFTQLLLMLCSDRTGVPGERRFCVRWGGASAAACHAARGSPRTAAVAVRGVEANRVINLLVDLPPAPMSCGANQQRTLFACRSA